MSYNLGHRRNRLRKGKRGITSSNWYSSRATYRPVYNKHRRTPEWGALYRAWVGYTIANNEDDEEQMRKYALVIRKFEKRLNIAINDFPEIGIYGFEDFRDMEEDDDSKLAVYDSRTGEKMREAKEDGNEEEEDNASYYQGL